MLNDIQILVLAQTTKAPQCHLLLRHFCCRGRDKFDEKVLSYAVLEELLAGTVCLFVLRQAINYDNDDMHDFWQCSSTLPLKEESGLSMKAMFPTL